MQDSSRRRFLKAASATCAATLLPLGCSQSGGTEPWFRISLAQWSLHRAFQNGVANPQNFPRLARQLFGIEAVEYVNQFYADSLSDRVIKNLKGQADGEGVQNLLVMVDGEGQLGADTQAERQHTVTRHRRWAEMAKALGCHSIRVNAQSSGSYAEQMKKAADGLRLLAENCADLGLNVLVENHGGLSSNGQWLAGVMELADHPRVGTLPDFGNFTIDRDSGEKYDRYQGVRELMPWAKAVSAKSYDFDNSGNALVTDFPRMLGIVKDAGYRGWVGIEYEGNRLSEFEGIRHTLALLERIRRAG
ncbi:sugar phosphate isomerase/epimerase family protein [Microbulbifer yueqingensis]|uniref:Tat (Twin-arginine translocation) pathway signal sequence n=1 Tax=Microbulbifer yueqingensis TaxID=658219 RepID=A0A1G9CV78_9GAMM|nr:sugar phosphate isomerase/epimerase family protein [Microbulbifer yueqingensis]SDK55334.1 Tat (twin-arginine translocation) pathway signal sequence [Microbulbifer yueqingensis]